MKDALKYLEAILPPNGLRVIASKPAGWSKGFRHTFHATNEEVIQETARLEAAGTQSWMALATYADPEGGRKGTNTVDIQTLFMDVDYKDHESPEAAHADAQRFFDFLGQPSIQVVSGGGLHAYWVLRSPMSTADWLPLATAFKAAWQGMDVKADASVSSDMARVLRMPGTTNRKEAYGPAGRTVEMIEFNDLTYTPEALSKKLATVVTVKAPKHVIPATSIPGGMYDMNDDLSGGVQRRESHIKELVGRCNQMRHVFKNQATVSEPVWYAAIQVCRHVVDGRKAAHVFSNKHPDYSVENTDAKLAQLEANDVGPTKCDRFRSLNPAGCEGCQFNVTSPIMLGYKDQETVQPTIQIVEHVVTEDGEVATVERNEHPTVTMPEGYKFNGTTIFKRMYDEESKAYSDVAIFNGFLCPERLVTSERNNWTTEIQFYVQSQGQPAKRLTIPSKAIADKKDLARELSSKGVFFMGNDANHILDMLMKMVQEVQATRRDATMADQMGWQDDGTFVVGTTGHRPDGSPLYDLPVPASIKAVARSYEPAGSLEAWKKAADVYNREGAEAYQFAVCYGAAGIFLPMAGLSGAVLALYSQSAGRGKSTVGFAALSWWGDPANLKSQSKDTNNALFSKASRHKNLPILMDEITDKPSHELEDLVYFMTQGREKESLTSDRTPRAIMPGWELPVISTANNSIRSKLQAKRGDAQGLFARIIEVPMDLPFAQTLSLEDRTILRHGFVQNYGVAGPKMLKYAMEHRERLAALMDRFTRRLDKAVDGDSAYRFWVASTAAALTVAAAATEAGILSYDVVALTQWAANLLRSQRAEAVTSLATADDVLAQFLETNANRIVVSYMRDMGAGTEAPSIWPQDGVHGSMLVGRAELSAKSLFVSLPAFSRFCHDSGFDVASFIRNAAATRDPISGEPLLRRAESAYVNLGRGTKTASARTKSLDFNLMHPSLREYATGIDARIAEVTNLRSVK